MRKKWYLGVLVVLALALALDAALPQGHMPPTRRSNPPTDNKP